MTQSNNQPRDRRPRKETIGQLIPRQFSEEAFNELIDACDHIARTCRKSATDTRRIRWIEARAISAIQGDNDWRDNPLPKTRSRVEVAEGLIAQIFGEVREYADQLRASYEEGPGGPIRDRDIVESLHFLENFVRIARNLPPVRRLYGPKAVDRIQRAKDLGWQWTAIELVDGGQAYGYESPDKQTFLRTDELINQMQYLEEHENASP